jgi:demethylmenaquinone methyltransferase/2-methoxy-6-polyprenyl-1,4-benzoquinol methylase
MIPQWPMTDPGTHFGFREVAENQKAGLVRGVFDSVADNYDLMNDLMSLGMHRLWKEFAIRLSGVHPGSRVLDVAAGSGDLARLLARRAGPEGSVTLTDINAAMLDRGRQRMTDDGIVGYVHYVQADAERLPFAPDYFDCICIGFGLRNVTRQERALASMFECLRPGGKFIVLEFSQPTTRLLRKIYDGYSYRVLPRLGQRVAGDEASYQYLVESIRKHPAQVKLKKMMQQAGFERVAVNNLAGGIVAVHTGYKF